MIPTLLESVFFAGHVRLGKANEVFEDWNF